MGLVLGIYILLLGGIAVICVLIEKSMIKKRSKFEWILPIVVTALLLFAATENSFVQSNSIGTHNKVLTFSIEGDTHATVSIYQDNEEHVNYISQLITDEGEQSRYMDLEFRKGKLIGGDEALVYKSQIEEALSSELKDFSGKSSVYGELQQLSGRGKMIKNFSPRSFLVNVIVYCILPLILWAMFIASKVKRRKEKYLEKTKLEDL